MLGDESSSFVVGIVTASVADGSLSGLEQPTKRQRVATIAVVSVFMFLSILHLVCS